MDGANATSASVVAYRTEASKLDVPAGPVPARARCLGRGLAVPRSAGSGMTAGGQGFLRAPGRDYMGRSRCTGVDATPVAAGTGASRACVWPRRIGKEVELDSR